MSPSNCDQWKFSKTQETYITEQAASSNSAVGASKYPNIEE